MMAAELYRRIPALPKIDLHRHLEGSVRLTTLIDIALEYGIEMPEYDVETLRPFVQVMPDGLRTPQHFLSKFMTLRQFFRSPEVIQRVTAEAVADAAADRVVYLELRFTPAALSNIIRCDYRDVIEWVSQAAAAAAREHGIQVGLIVSMNRHESVEIGARVLEAARPFLGHGVVALDLAGNEQAFPAAPFADIFAQARADGFGITIHAGEWAGPESIHTAVYELGAERIGHGVRLIEDRALLSELVDRGIVLEVCPSSNLDSGVVSEWSYHPLPALCRQQVRTTINTDDPLVSNITLSQEIGRAVQHLGLTLDEVKRQMLHAAEAAFLPPPERSALAAWFDAKWERVLNGDESEIAVGTAYDPDR